MQIINHKNPTLTACQRLFIEKSLELLHLGSIDSYRVRLNNPKSILKELKYCLEQFREGRIKHFHTIRAKEKDKKAIADEALALLEYDPHYLKFTSVSKKYLEQLIKTIDENNYKKLISTIDIVLNENQNYLVAIFSGAKILIDANNMSLAELEKIDLSLNMLFSELIDSGYSKGYLYRLVFGIFVASLNETVEFNLHFDEFRDVLISDEREYNIIFRINTTRTVLDSISGLANSRITLLDSAPPLLLTGRQALEFSAFSRITPTAKFLQCKTIAKDYLSALKTARSILSEYLDVINLGLADELLEINQRVLVVDSRYPESGNFQNNVNVMDGKYRVEKDHYQSFALKLPAILNNDNIQNETKEKIKSAIRYLRFGNQSTEVEHKFVNYWIGLEYLFSNYESQNTINRLKEQFINAHALAYVKRNTYSFKKDFSQVSSAHQAMVPAYTPESDNCLKTETFYVQIEGALLNDYPLLAYRAMKLHKWFFPGNGRAANATEYLKKHKSNLEIHFTRIYRLRNEIIHDAATNTNNEHIASNLRYYLTFILNELIDSFARITTLQVSIEDYFIQNEIEIGNIEHGGYLLEQLLAVDSSIDFIS